MKEDLGGKVAVEEAHHHRAEVERERERGEHGGHGQQHGPDVRGDQRRGGGGGLLHRLLLGLLLEDQDHRQNRHDGGQDPQQGQNH
ncbi:unnamed protein product [Menidia menidia]|uniref:(Atlantic silverside) hypothetical protein n=1 Tax=Menidia menidia TaxID=238744 RepID=A0A8S4AEH1_9TELE|nr:unnamed protein product [Menidia menidia]